MMLFMEHTFLFVFAFMTRFCLTNSRGGVFFTKTTCENDVMTLRCHDHRSSRLFISNVFYGRRNPNKCSAGKKSSLVPTGGCQSTRAMDKVARNCHGRFQCRLKVSSHIFGDPCPQTSKYLHVVYMCIHIRYFTRKVGCEEDTLNLNCPRQTKIFLGYTFFGRKRKNVCGDNQIGNSLSRNSLRKGGPMR